MYRLAASLLFQGTKTVFWYTGGNLIYIVTPNSVYNVVGGLYGWFYPPKTDSERLIEELQEINRNLIELRESGVVVVESNGETKDIVIDTIIKFEDDIDTIIKFEDDIEDLTDTELPVATIVNPRAVAL